MSPESINDLEEEAWFICMTCGDGTGKLGFGYECKTNNHKIIKVIDCEKVKSVIEEQNSAFFMGRIWIDKKFLLGNNPKDKDVKE